MSIVDGYQGVVDAKRSNATPQTTSGFVGAPYRGSDVSLVGGSANRDFSAVQTISVMPEEPTPVPVQQIKPGYTAISPNRHE
jgi:hypothetical protein